MNKTIRFFIPFIVAFLFLGTLFWLAGESIHAVADPSPSSPDGSILVTTLDDEMNIDGDCSLREAISAANDNTPVDACPAGDAVITDTITFDVAGVITVTSQLEVTEGGPLVIDGGDVITTSGGGAVTVWWVGAGSELILQHLTEMAGYSGALYNDDGDVTIVDSVFKGNSSTYDGAGLYNTYYGTLILIDCIVDSNEVYPLGEFPGKGAGLYNYGKAIVINSSFTGNIAPDGSGGGGIYNSGEISIVDSAFIGNSGGNGAAMINNGTAQINSSTFANNTALGWYGGSGGAITNYGTLEITNTMFSNNVTGGPGGGIASFIGSLFITDSSIISNSASNGGGITNGGILMISNTTLQDNHAENGAGLVNGYFGFNGCAYVGSTTIRNGTFSGNEAQYNGGGISNICDSIIQLTNTTIADNTASIGAGIYQETGTVDGFNTIIASTSGEVCSGIITDEGHNISSDDTCGLDPANGSLPNTDPHLGSLKDNGGLTWTHALLPGSPAIDAGDNAQCPPTDQRGTLRPRDGDGDGMAVCDIGSYELEGRWVSPTQVTITGPDEATPGPVVYFTATVEPISTTMPLTYIWQASGHPPITETRGLTDTVGWAWELPGTQLITVTISNPAGTVSTNHVITITTPIYDLFLPLVIKPVETPLGTVPDSSSPERGVLFGLITIEIASTWKRKV